MDRRLASSPEEASVAAPAPDVTTYLDEIVGEPVCHIFTCAVSLERACCGVPRAEQPVHTPPLYRAEKIRTPFCPWCGQRKCPRCVEVVLAIEGRS